VHRRLNKRGVATGCGQCNVEWHREHSEEDRARLKVSYQSNPKVFWQRNLKNKYGITVTDYERMLAEQGGLCAICRGQETRAGFQLGVDHDHATGSVRGLLCTSCNTAIGLLGDSQERVLALVAYLQKYQGAASEQHSEEEKKNESY